MNIWKIATLVSSAAALSMAVYSLIKSTEEPEVVETTPAQTDAELVAVIKTNSEQCAKLYEELNAMTAKYDNVVDELNTVSEQSQANADLVQQCEQLTKTIIQLFEVHQANAAATQASVAETLNKADAIIQQHNLSLEKFNTVQAQNSRAIETIKVIAQGYSSLNHTVEESAQQCDQIASVVNDLIEKSNAVYQNFETVAQRCDQIATIAEQTRQHSTVTAADVTSALALCRQSAETINNLVMRHDKLTKNNLEFAQQLAGLTTQCAETVTTINAVSDDCQKHLDIIDQAAQKHTDAINGVNATAQLCVEAAGSISSQVDQLKETAAQITASTTSHNQLVQLMDKVIVACEAVSEIKIPEFDAVLLEFRTLIAGINTVGARLLKFLEIEHLRDKTLITLTERNQQAAEVINEVTLAYCNTIRDIAPLVNSCYAAIQTINANTLPAFQIGQPLLTPAVGGEVEEIATNIIPVRTTAMNNQPVTSEFEEQEPTEPEQDFSIVVKTSPDDFLQLPPHLQNARIALPKSTPPAEPKPTQVKQPDVEPEEEINEYNLPPFQTELFEEEKLDMSRYANCGGFNFDALPDDMRRRFMSNASGTQPSSKTEEAPPPDEPEPVLATEITPVEVPQVDEPDTPLGTEYEPGKWNAWMQNPYFHANLTPEEQETRTRQLELSKTRFLCEIDTVQATGFKIDPETVPDDPSEDPKPPFFCRKYPEREPYKPFIIPKPSERMGYHLDLEEQIKRRLRGCNNLHWYGGDITRFMHLWRHDDYTPIMEDEDGNPVVLRFGEWPEYRYETLGTAWPSHTVQRTTKQHWAHQMIKYWDMEVTRIRQERFAERARAARQKKDNDNQ